MASKADSGASSGRPRFSLLIGLVAVVAVGWSVLWVVVRGDVEKNVDQSVAEMARNGLVLECPERSFGGYPFRIELRCPAGFTATDRIGGASVRFKAGLAVAMLYSPNHIIVEFEGPAEASARGGSLAATWSLLQASLRFKDGQLARASVAVDGLDGKLRAPGQEEALARADRFELHVRPEPESAGVAAATLVRAGTLTVGGRVLGPGAIDLSADAVADNLPGALGPGFLPAWAASGGRLQVKSVRVATGGAALDGNGVFDLETDGTVTGTARLIATGLDVLAANGKAIATPELAVLASGFMLFGKPVKEGAPNGRSLDFVIERGRMRLGVTPLGKLPPLFRAAPGS